MIHIYLDHNDCMLHTHWYWDIYPHYREDRLDLKFPWSLFPFFIAGKPSRALDTLYDVIKSKKRNHNFSEKLIEEIMFRYLELCVDLKKSHVAKEGLFQYRNMCQSTNVASLASVVQGYLNMAEKRTESARQESADSVEVSNAKIYSTKKKFMESLLSN